MPKSHQSRAELRVNAGAPADLGSPLPCCRVLVTASHSLSCSWHCLCCFLLLVCVYINIHTSCWVFIKPACSQSKIHLPWFSYYPLPVLCEKALQWLNGFNKAFGGFENLQNGPRRSCDGFSISTKLGE